MTDARRQGAMADHLARGITRRVKRGVLRAAWAGERWVSDHYVGPPSAFRRQTIIEALGVNLILDVGANIGTYGQELRDHGYGGRLVSFEPISSVFAQLQDRSRGDSAWEAERLALGAERGSFPINVAANRARSSSFLPQLDVTFGTTATQRYVGSEVVVQSTLSEELPRLLRRSERILLKLDVQGVELEVLRGAQGALSSIVAVEAEMSLRPLYQGQPMFREVVDHLDQLGFKLWALEPGYTNYETGQLIEMDGIFVREPPAP